MGVQGEGFAVRIFVDGLASGSGRTIAPEHVTLTELADPSKYTVRLTGTSDMGDSRDEVLTVNNKGLGIFLLTPGSWILTLTVTEVATNQQILQGKTFIVVENAPTVTNMTLKPLTGGTGTVEVNFVLSPSLLKRLVVTNPTGTGTTGLAGASGQANLTVALYKDGVEVLNTRQTLQATITGASTTEQTLTYTGNGQSIPAGQYILKLTGSFPKQDGSIETMGYEDIIHIEGNRKTSATIALDDNAQVYGVPSKTRKSNKANLGGSIGNPNFKNTERFTTYGDTVWIYAVNWDGNSSDEISGNEVLTIGWDPVYNADFYEVEVMLSPFIGIYLADIPYPKFTDIVTSDDEWDRIKAIPITDPGTSASKLPTILRFSGKTSDPDYYKSKSYIIQVAVPSHKRDPGPYQYNRDFYCCADKTLARTLPYGNYTIGANLDAFDNNTNFIPAEGSERGQTLGKIGLEGDCGTLGVLLPSYAPRTSVCIRVRAGNEFGYSDWVYWKGGKN